MELLFLCHYKIEKMKSFKIIFHLITAVFLTTIIIGCEKDEPAITGCTDKYSLNYNPRATLNDGSCIENNPVSMDFAVNLSDSACLKNCQIDKIVRVKISTVDDDTYSDQRDYIAECEMSGTFSGIRIPGEYCLNVYHVNGSRETFIRKECLTITQSRILINQVPDVEIILEENEVCKK